MKLPTPSGARDSRRRSRWFFIGAVAILVVLIAALASAGAVAPVSGLCGSCHEIAPQVRAWAQSPHANVACASCHEVPTRWYGYPRRLAGRAALLSRDVYQHLSGEYSSANATNSARSSAIPDAACTQCHNPRRPQSSRGGVILDHAAHAKMNKSCLSCHLDTAHPDPSADAALVMMEQCFTCHGLSQNAKAPGTCETCHPDYFDLPPTTHKAATWRTEHGPAAESDRQQCEMCHREAFCDDCHGLEMPHPTGWARGPSGHSVAAERNRGICSKCHTGKPNPCSACHHQSFELQGLWIVQHPGAVRESGTSACMRCHEPTFCGDCHRSSAQP